MAWLFEITITQQLAPQYIWCDWPKAQRCLFRYAPLIGHKGWQEVGEFGSYKGETWFSQWAKPEDDPDRPFFVESPGSEGRGTYIRASPIYYVLHLSGVEHTNPQTPKFGQSGSGEILENNFPKPITWRLLANYPNT